MRLQTGILLSLLACLATAGAYRDPHVRKADADAKAWLRSNPGAKSLPTRVLVRYVIDTAETDKQKAAKGVGALRMHKYRLVEGLELLDTPRAAQAIEALRKNPKVLYAEPDRIAHAIVTPNDPSFGSLWGMHQANNVDIDAPAAWDILTGSSIVIADIDTGIDYNHPDLAANIWTNPAETAGNSVDDDGNGFVDDVHGYDFVNNDGDPMDDHFHGTHTTGTFGAVGNNGVGVAGVNWTCRAMGLKFLNSGGSGSLADAIRAMEYATAMGVKVSNNSWGWTGGPYQPMDDAIIAAQAVNHVFVAAAGNAGLNNDANPLNAGYPASSPADNIISVAAVDETGARAWFSSYGATTVDLAAPGVNVLSTTLAGGYGSFSGTSMATPHVTGVVALVQAQNPTWTYSQVITRVLSTTKPLASMAGICVTGGMVSASAALGAAPPAAPPATPGRPNATRSATGWAFVTWVDNSNNETSFQIERQQKIGKGWGSLATATVAAGTTSILDNAGRGQFRYRLRAVNGSGNSAWTAWSNSVKL